MYETGRGEYDSWSFFSSYWTAKWRKCLKPICSPFQGFSIKKVQLDSQSYELIDECLKKVVVSHRGEVQ